MSATDLYGLPSAQVQGTSVRNEFITKDGKPMLVRSYRMDYLDNWDGKPSLIEKVTDKVMPLAKKEGWIVIDMKNDWKTVFPVK